LLRGNELFIKTVICYPFFDEEEYKRRVEELERLGVEEIISEGRIKIGEWRVLGKGHVGVVVSAKHRGKDVALKIRRVDANRDSMLYEAELLKRANRIGVGPKLIEASKNFIVMEKVKGVRLGDWISEEKDRERLKAVILDLLDQCYRMDRDGFVHKELSRPENHVIVDLERLKPVIIDFETVSVVSKGSNVTSVAGFLFVGKRGVVKDEELKRKIVEKLRKYKKERSEESYRELVELIKKVL